MVKPEPSPAEIELVLLSVLRAEPLYGYAISKRLSAESDGVIRLSPGVLYPLLRSLEVQGLITASWEEVRSERSQEEAARRAAEDSSADDEPAALSGVGGAGGGRKRKWYKLTAKGRKRLEQRLASHRTYQAMLERIVSLGIGGAAQTDRQAEGSA